MLIQLHGSIEARLQSRTIGVIFVTLSHSNSLNAPKGLVNTALSAHRLIQRALAKRNLVLKYT